MLRKCIPSLFVFAILASITVSNVANGTVIKKSDVHTWNDDNVVCVIPVDSDTVIVDDTVWGEFVPAYDPDYDNDYAVTSVAGVDFGDSKYSAISKFKTRFGYQYTDNGTSLTFYNPNIGGNEFTFGEFYFDNNKFSAAQLIKVFKSTEFAKAKQFRDNIASQYGAKYKNINSKINKEGYKYYRCGRLVKNVYPIMIYVFKGESKGGQMMYYVHVDYFDIDGSLSSDI